MKPRIGGREPADGGWERAFPSSGLLLVVLLGVSCSGSPGTAPPTVSNNSTSFAAAPFRNDELRLEMRKLGVNPDLVVQSSSRLRVQDIDPLMKFANPVRIKPEPRLADQCSTYQLTLLDNTGASVSGVKWFLDKNYFLKDQFAELDRDTGVLKTKIRSTPLYTTAFVRGVGAWAEIGMSGVGCTVEGSPGPKPPTPAPTPTPSGGGQAVEHNFGSF